MSRQINPGLFDRSLEFTENRRQAPNVEYIVTTGWEVTMVSVTDSDTYPSTLDGDLPEQDEVLAGFISPYIVIADGLLTQLHNDQFAEPTDLIPERFKELNFTVMPDGLPNATREFNRMAEDFIGDAQRWDVHLKVNIKVRAEVHSWGDTIRITVILSGLILKYIEGGGDYKPYLWIGIRQTDTKPFVFANGNYYGPKPNINLFEPALPEDTDRRIQCLSDRSDWVSIVNYLGYLLGDDANYNVDIENTLQSTTIGVDADLTETTDKLVYVYGRLPKLRWTDGGCYLLTHGYAWNPHDSELWEQVAILDPEDPEKTIEPFDNWTPFGPYHLPSTTILENWSIQGEVIPGEYVLNIGAPSIYDCHDNYDQPVSVEVKIILGRPSGRQIKWQGTVQCLQSTLISQQVPYGFYNWGFEASSDFGPNPKNRGWWPGSFRIDVERGVIRYQVEDYMTDTGFLIKNLFSPFNKTAPIWTPKCMACTYTPGPLTLWYPWELIGGEKVYNYALNYLQNAPVIVTGVDEYGECCRCEGMDYYTGENGYILGSGMSMNCRDSQAFTSGFDTHYSGWNVGDTAAITVLTVGSQGHASDYVGIFKTSTFYENPSPDYIIAMDYYKRRGWVFGSVGGREVPVVDPAGYPVDLTV